MPIVQSLSDSMMTLTHTIEILIIRKKDGEYVNGKWIPGEPEQVTIKGNVQPLKMSELMLLPESERTNKHIKVYTREDVFNFTDGDDVIYDGEKYKVLGVKSYKMGVLDHYQFTAARYPISAGAS